MVRNKKGIKTPSWAYKLQVFLNLTNAVISCRRLQQERRCVISLKVVIKCSVSTHIHLSPRHYEERARVPCAVLARVELIPALLQVLLDR